MKQQIEYLMKFINDGEMDSALEEYGPHYVIGCLRAGIKLIAEDLEKELEKERTRAGA